MLLECSIFDFHFRCERIIYSNSYDVNHPSAQLHPVGACWGFRRLFLLATVKNGSQVYENLCIPCVEELGGCYALNGTLSRPYGSHLTYIWFSYVNGISWGLHWSKRFWYTLLCFRNSSRCFWCWFFSSVDQGSAFSACVITAIAISKRVFMMPGECFEDCTKTGYCWTVVGIVFDVAITTAFMGSWLICTRFFMKEDRFCMSWVLQGSSFAQVSSCLRNVSLPHDHSWIAHINVDDWTSDQLPLWPRDCQSHVDIIFSSSHSS